MFPSSLFHIGGDEVTDHYECWDQDASITGGRACMQIFVYFVRHVAPGASNLAPVLSVCYPSRQHTKKRTPTSQTHHCIRYA